MAARPRKPKFKDLPPNLYGDKKGGKIYYKYKRPDTGETFHIGTDKLEAIAAAKQLNSMLMTGRDLISKVMDKEQGVITLTDFITVFSEEEIPQRQWAKDTLDLFNIRVRQINNVIGSKPIDEVTIRDVADFLETLTARASNQARAYLSDIFDHAVAKGLCADNPAAKTIKRREKKQRKRHTVEGLKAIRDASPVWLQNAIDIALITAQRRGDILNMRFNDVKNGYLYVVQQKTERASDCGWIRFEITPQLRDVINRCRDDIPSPFLIHRNPERNIKGDKEHWTQIQGRYLSDAFKKARDDAGVYSHFSDKEMPTFHEIRALSIHLYTKAGKDAQKIAGHASPDMTKNYEKNHEDIIWSDATPDLDISKII